MNGPSLTPLARTVLALSAESSWCPASASFPELPYFSYQAPISAIHPSRQGPSGSFPLIPRTAHRPFRHRPRDIAAGAAGHSQEPGSHRAALDGAFPWPAYPQPGSYPIAIGNRVDPAPSERTLAVPFRTVERLAD